MLTVEQQSLGPVILDPVKFARGILGHDTWTVQEQILQSVAKNRRTAVKACHSSGKCVAYLELLTLWNGSRIQAKDLIGTRFSLPSLNLFGEVIEVQARAESNGVEPVYRLTTESGRTVVRNAAHPLWAADGIFPRGNRCKITPLGWTPLGELKVGQLVAATERLPVFGAGTLTEVEAKILAYLIGDGGFTATNVVFTQLPGKQLDEFKECVESYGCDLKFAGRYSWRVCGVKGKIKRRTCTKTGIVSHTVNKVIDLLTAHNLRFKHSRDKRIPEAVFALPREKMAVFLSRLYSTDGWASDGVAAEVGFCSVSKGLVEDVQALLLRFGIAGRILHKPKVNAWTVVVNSSSDVLTFCDSIGIYGKEPAVEKVRAHAQRQQRSKQLRRWRWKKAPPGTRWERIESIEPAGSEETVAIEVPEGHTYLTSLWEHNSYLASEAALWWITRWPDGIVVTTAPSWVQVERILWGNIRQFLGSAKIKYPRPGLTELRLAPNRYAIGLSTNEGVRFQGFHGKILIIIDEAPGVKADIWESIEGIRAGGDVRVLALGNPTISSGPFYDAFASNRSSWSTFTISAFGTPNLAGCKLTYKDSAGREQTLGAPDGIDLLEMSEDALDRNSRPYLTTRRWVKEKFLEWGPLNPVFESRVCGNFPAQAPDALISLAWIEAAVLRELDTPPSTRVRAGIDVAGPGEDETVLCIREGPRILEIIAWPDADSRGAILAKLKSYGDRLERASVDSAGIGYFLFQHLRDNGIPAVAINVGTSSSDKEKFVNLKAELYWGLRMRFEAGDVCGSMDEKTIGQLTGIRWKPNPRGQTVIEPKDEAVKRGVRSPDRAEAVMLAFEETVVENQGILDWYRQQATGVLT